MFVFVSVCRRMIEGPRAVRPLDGFSCQTGVQEYGPEPGEINEKTGILQGKNQ